MHASKAILFAAMATAVSVAPVTADDPVAVKTEPPANVMPADQVPPAVGNIASPNNPQPPVVAPPTGNGWRLFNNSRLFNGRLLGDAPPPVTVNGPPLADAVPPGNAPAFIVPPVVGSGVAPTAPPLVPAAHTPKPYGHFSFEFDLLLAWLDSGRLPPLVTTAPATTPLPLAGRLDQPTTQILFGNNSIGEDARCGFRFRGLYSLDGSCHEGVELSFLCVGREGETFAATSNGSQILARPYFDALNSVNTAELVAFPGAQAQAGEIRVRTASDLCGVDVNLRRSVLCLGCVECDRGSGWRGCQLDALFGYRGLRYRDKVTIDQVTRALNPELGTTTRPVVHDSFYARSMFHGAQVGLNGRIERADFFLDGRVLGAIGQRSSRADVNGRTELAQPDQPRVTVNGGLLALPSNIGVYLDEDATFVGELGMKAGYKLNQYANVTFGYTALYYGSVIRSGELIDRAVNPSQLPPGTLGGPARPAVVIEEGDIWAHALSLGLEFRY